MCVFSYTLHSEDQYRQFFCQVRTFGSDAISGPPDFKALASRSRVEAVCDEPMAAFLRCTAALYSEIQLEMGLGQVVVVVGAGVTGRAMHYLYESPRKDRNARVSVSVCVR